MKVHLGRRPHWPGLLAAPAMLLALASANISADRYLADVKYLASEELKGRGTGTPELEKAALYIAGQFRAAGLETAAGEYFQKFQVSINAHLGPDNRLSYGNGDKGKLAVEQDFIPFNFSTSGTFAGPVVFAGYGITAAEYGYDDYAGVDVKDKIVLLLRHEPQEFDEKSVFSGKIYTEHAQFASKATNARMHGAKGVIFVNDVGAHAGEADSLEKFARAVGPADAGIAFVQMKAETADRWLALAGPDKNVKDLQAAIDKDLKPRSFALPASLQVKLSVDVRRDRRDVHNVAAYLPGETDEYVIIGAHYDHLGLGEQFSMSPSEAGHPHPGADDNASGTAGVLELARYMAARPKLKRGVLFLTFAGEELGLLGSGFYVRQPLLPVGKAVAMINLDMIGRVREGKVFVGGTETGSTLRSVIDEVAPKYGLNLDYSDQTGYGSSDHTSFTTQRVPVLFFFSGLHSDYHKPSDTWDKIDAPEAARLLRLVAEVAEKLAQADRRPQFVLTASQAPRGGMGGGGGYGAWFGSVPDFSEVPGGFRFADVTPGSPADQAGLKGGDILFEFDGKPIQNLYDFTYALRARKPGETVVVKVRRGDSTVESKVRLARRR